jgi:CelD/BcsL family acetyltransferase involved in cellulose biosynthesis
MPAWDICSSEEFSRYSPQWDDLNAKMGGVPFLQAMFIGSALKWFGDGKEVLAIRQGQAGVDAIALLTQRGRGKWHTFQPSQLPLGACLVAPELPVEAIMHELLTRIPGLALVLGFTQLDPQLVKRPNDTSSLKALDYIQTAWVEIDSTFDDYWASRGKNLRQNMKRQRAKLDKEGVTTTLEVVTERERVAEAIADYGTLESAGWKAGRGTAIHPDNAQGKFYREVFEDFCSRGKARIFRYRLDGRVVAVDLCLDNGPLHVVLKTTYDESIRTISPSSLMRQEIFRILFADQRTRRIEFYGKLMEWHTRWTDKVRTLYHVNRYRWPLLKTIQDLRSRPVAPEKSVQEGAE